MPWPASWTSLSPRSTSTLPAAGESLLHDRGGLSHLDEIPVRIAHVASDLARVLLGRSQELRALAPPFFVRLLDVCHANVQKRARLVPVVRWLEDDIRFVICRAATDVDDDPSVGELDGRRFPLGHDLAAQHIPVEGS